MESYVWPMQNVQQLAHALVSHTQSSALATEALVRVHYPREHCRLLGYQVVLLDSPGIDVAAQVSFTYSTPTVYATYYLQRVLTASKSYLYFLLIPTWTMKKFREGLSKAHLFLLI